MAKHARKFLDLVNDARTRIRECQVHDVKTMLDAGQQIVLIDVREDSEFARDHLPHAVHLGKGIIERDIEQLVPDSSARIVVYCGGGYRSALAADNLMKMEYTNVVSVDGGIKGWREAGYPTQA